MNISGQNYYIDIHTFSPCSAADTLQIINLFPEQVIDRLPAFSLLETDVNPYKCYYSLGWHPRHLREEKQTEYINLIAQVCQRKEILAVGECGLDRLSEASMDYQEAVFKKQALIAEEIGKPLLIHCVRANNELIRIKKELKPKAPWVVHGFNSKPVAGRELLRHGFYISLGSDLLKPVSNANEFISEIPLERLFLETGDLSVSVKEIYSEAAMKSGQEITLLVRNIRSNFTRVFQTDLA
ncbi:MAG: TatD family hydrolase [Bacteroidota bacterium]|nr:TatD family hydrolase [Bacteroidota bacterium]